MILKPCVRCLCAQIKKVIAGQWREAKIIQCVDCGFNVTALSWREAEKMWNDFKVWKLVPKARRTVKISRRNGK